MEKRGEKGLKRELLKALDKLRMAKVLVIGDVMLDIYLYGEVERLSPEAPVPVVKLNERKEMPGGAGNSAMNLVSVGGIVYIMGVVGKDESGRRLKELIGERMGNKIFVEEERVTTTKTRVVARSQHIVRFDEEFTDPIRKETEAEVILIMRELAAKFKTVLVSDYGKGFITSRIMKYVKRYFKKVIVDPFARHRKLYKDLTAILPNEREARALSQAEGEDIKESARVLCDELRIEYAIVKRGEKGMYLWDGKKSKGLEIPALRKEVYDVAGAGDTVSAIFSAGIDVGIDVKVLTYLSSIFASIVVTKTGTATAHPDEVRAEIERFFI